MDHQLLRQKFCQKFCQKISVIKTNTHDDITKNSSFWNLNSHFVSKTTITQVFVLRFSDELFDVIIDVEERFCYFDLKLLSFVEKLFGDFSKC